MKILVKFHNQPTIEIAVDNTKTGRLYFDLTRQQNEQQQPFYRDPVVYTPEYMVELAHQAKKAFNWDWFSDQYDISITAQLHKDIENSVGQLGFAQIPREHHMLLYDLHHCLHNIQFGKKLTRRSGNFQIEWLTATPSVPLPADFEFKESTAGGDLILINPYVGHNPLQIYHENDFTSLETTCRFHDIIKPGIVLTHAATTTKNQILTEFQRQDPEFVKLHGADKISYYAGAAVIGHVVDNKILNQVVQSKDTLMLDQVEFYE